MAVIPFLKTYIVSIVISKIKDPGGEVRLGDPDGSE